MSDGFLNVVESEVRDKVFRPTLLKMLNNLKSNIPPKFSPIQEGKISDFSDLR